MWRGVWQSFDRISAMPRAVLLSGLCALIPGVFAGGNLTGDNLTGDEAWGLAQRCVPVLERRGLCNISAIERVETHNLLQLWTGLGGIDEVNVTGPQGDSCSFVTKTIRPPDALKDDPLALVDHMSYYNEVNFYDQDLAGDMHSAGMRCPRSLLVDREESGVVRIAMTKVPGAAFKQTNKQTKAALQWLARLHAHFWGDRAAAAALRGIASKSSFWHLDARRIELDRMPAQDPLRLAAVGLDARLKADPMQTICHGDPKGANMVWDPKEGIAFYDFQWFGRGPPSRDLAYFMGVAASVASAEAEEALLRHYHAELQELLAAHGDTVPAFEDLHDSYRLAMCDLARWMVGGFKFGNVNLIFGHVESLVGELQKDGVLTTEREFQTKIFGLFPPGGGSRRRHGSEQF